LTGAGTLRLTGEGNLVFGGLGNVNISFSTGALIDVESGQLTGSSSYGGTWTSNMASLNIASGATFDAVEAGSTGTMQIDALTGAGIFSGGYFGNTAATSTVTIGIAGGGGIFSGSLEDDVSAHLAIIKAGAGTQIFTGTNTYTGKTTVSAGKLIIGAAGALPTNAQLTIGTSSNAASVQFTPGIGENNLTLNLLDGSIFDLTNDSAMITYTGVSTYATIYGFLASGYNSGRWDGPGIDSSIAANSNGSTTLGYSSTGTQMLIKYTWTGDANLDGIVNDADLSSISPTGTTWSTGDFNFDGKVNADDYALFMLGNAVSKGANISTTLPEPATPFIVDLGVCWILACRRGSNDCDWLLLR
jgi:autotransporter-associated beta strand protein